MKELTVDDLDVRTRLYYILQFAIVTIFSKDLHHPGIKLLVLRGAKEWRLESIVAGLIFVSAVLSLPVWVFLLIVHCTVRTFT